MSLVDRQTPALTDAEIKAFKRQIADGVSIESVAKVHGIDVATARVLAAQNRRAIIQLENQSIKKPQPDPANAVRLPCNFCGRPFHSEHAGIRTCPDCKASPLWRELASVP